MMLFRSSAAWSDSAAASASTDLSLVNHQNASLVSGVFQAEKPVCKVNALLFKAIRIVGKPRKVS